VAKLRYIKYIFDIGTFIGSDLNELHVEYPIFVRRPFVNRVTKKRRNGYIRTLG